MCKIQEIRNFEFLSFGRKNSKLERVVKVLLKQQVPHAQMSMDDKENLCEVLFKQQGINGIDKKIANRRYRITT
jgi:hypothetical protein